MEERPAVPAQPTPAFPPTIRDFRRPDHPSRAGQRLVAGYEVLGELGEGGMSVVYLARQVQLDRLVALKMIRSARADREELLRFRTEAEAMARLAHPNIVQIYEVGEHDGEPFFSLEYCPAGSLDRHLGGVPMAPRQAAQLMEVLARAVDHAHRHGVVHRDLKPGNVLLTFSRGSENRAAGPTRFSEPRLNEEWVPKITDFGLAKRLDGQAQTRAGAIIGTPAYMAPEQAAGQNDRIGPTTDVYALGAILYECLAGQPPFQAESEFETLEQVRRLGPVSPRSLAPAVPRDLETICLRCLRKEPGKRYPSALELADDLGRWLRGEPIRARPVGTLERALRWAWRRPTAAALLIVTALLVAAVPLHIVELRARVAQARSEAVRAEEGRRRADLLAECRSWLDQGRQAMDRDSLQEAGADFDAIVKSIHDDDARQDDRLAGLRDEAGKLRRRIAVLLRRVAAQEAARDQARRFLALLDEAFFQFYRDMTDAEPTGPRLSQEAARQALKVFPNLGCLGTDEAPRLQLARQEALLLLAETTARAGDRKAALVLLDRAEALAPTQPTGTGWMSLHSIHRRRARYLEQLGRHDEAARQRARSQREQPAGALDWFLVGLDRCHAGNPRAALTAFDTALSEQPELFWPQFFRAVAFRHLGRLGEARGALELCIRARRDYVWPYLFRSSLYLREGDFDAALVDLDRAERLARDRSARYVVLVNRGVLALEQKQTRQAVEQFQRAVLLMPTGYHAHVNLARVYADRGDRARAIAALDQAVRLGPGRPSLYRTRARLEELRGRVDRALADLERAIRVGSPEVATDHRERARLLLRAGRYRESLAASRAARQLVPDNPDGLRLEGEALLELNRPREALAAFDLHLKYTRTPVADVYLRRARARAAMGDLASVVDEYSAALGLRKDAQGLSLRGWAYLVNGAPRQALRDFEAALALKSTDSNALVGRGTARVELGAVSEGIADVEAALRSGPRSARLVYNVARALARAAVQTSDARRARARADRAVAVLRQAIEAMPEADRARFWRDQVRRDTVFRSLSRHAGFGRLDRQFAD
jgi:tetratricopeptide (TPR) repeat protein